MMETVLQIGKQGYPFEEHLLQDQVVTVQDVQVFNSERALLEKKNEMVKKNHILKGSPYLIALQKIYQNQLSLHFTYQYIPYSLGNFVKVRFSRTKREVLEMSGKLFLKKISYELTMLISYLARSKIELDLSIRNLGLTTDEKLKVFMSSRCRMGHKTEVSLVALYGHSKQKIIRYLEQELEQLKKQSVNFGMKGKQMNFPKRGLEQSLLNSSVQPHDTIDDSLLNRQEDQGLFSSTIEQGKKPGINPFSGSVAEQNIADRISALRQTQSPRQKRNLNFSGTKSESGNRQHKNSFQFGVKRPKPKRKQDEDDNKSDTQSFSAARSIRIELEQQMDPKKKNRKDSYKVKITTFREYQMEHNGNPLDLFKNAGASGDDIFQHFESQARKPERQEENGDEDYRQSADVDDSLFSRYQGNFDSKGGEEEVYWQQQSEPQSRYYECYTPNPHHSSRYQCFTPNYRESSHFTTSDSSNKQESLFTLPNSPTKLTSKAALQEKVRLAKQKAAEIMTRHLRKNK